MFLRKRGLYSLILLFINVSCTKVMLDNDFHRNLKEREEVIRMVKNGEFEIKAKLNIIQLPERYRHLSRGGGVIMVEKYEDGIGVFFFTFRGILDNFSGFIYRDDNACPDSTDFSGDFKQVKSLGEGWFWAASY